MLIQGGMIRRGRRFTSAVDGAYWISCINSFWNMTLAFCGGKVLADPKRIRVGHRDRELSPTAFEILHQILQTLEQILAAGLDGRLQHLRVGGDEIGWRQGIHELARVEPDLVLSLRVEALDVVDGGQNCAREDLVALLDVVEHEVLGPGRVLKASVLPIGWVDSFDQSQQPSGGVLP